MRAAVESGAELDFDATGTGSTPMHVAAGFGSYEVVKYLFEVGGLPTIEVGLVRIRVRVRIRLGLVGLGNGNGYDNGNSYGYS